MPRSEFQKRLFHVLYVVVSILLPTVFAIFLITVAVFNPSSCRLLQFHLSYVPVLRLCQLM